MKTTAKKHNYTPERLRPPAKTHGGIAHNTSTQVVDVVNGGPGGDDLFASYSNDPSQWANCYNFHFTLLRNWVDPTTYAVTPGSSPIDSWTPISYGGNVVRLDTTTSRPSPGNDSTANLLTTLAADSTRNVTNFFIYLSAKPKSSATAGEHLGFGTRISYIYP